MEDARDLPTSLTRNYTKVICYPTDQIFSHGIWVGSSVFFYTLPVLMLQISALVIASRVAQVLLKPLRQPTAVSSIIGGILLGPSVLGLFSRIQPTLFPDSSYFVAEVMGHLGIVYQTFSVSVKMDISVLTMGRKPAMIGLVGLVTPLTAFVFFSVLLQEHTVSHVADGTFVVALGIALTFTPFAMIHSLLSDFQLLNTELGRLSLTVAMLNEAFGWLLMVYSKIMGLTKFSLGEIVIKFGPSLLIIVFLVLIIRPMLFWVIRRTPDGSKVEQGCIVSILLGVLVISMMTDAIGLGVLGGCIVLGLIVPNGPPLGSAIEERTDTVAREIFMPLFYAAVGQRLNLFAITDWTAFGVLVFLILVNRLAKLIGTMVSAVWFNLPFPQALTLGLILNTKGYVDMMEYMAMESFGMVDNQSYAALVLVAMVMTMIGSPLIARLSMQSGQGIPKSLRTIQHSKPHAELRLMACVHDQDNVPPVLNLLEATNPTEDKPVCIFVIRLIDLVGRATPMLKSHKPEKKNNVSFPGPLSNPIFGAFYNYQQRLNADDALHVQAFTSVSPYRTMHNDICSLALQQKVSLILLPFFKRQLVAGATSMVDNALQIVNPRILAQAPCSVGIIFDRGSLHPMFALDSVGIFRIGVLFFGGPDDREALSFAARMVENRRTALTIIRFLCLAPNVEKVGERALDDDLVIEFRAKWGVSERIIYQEKMVHDGEDTVNVIHSIEDVYDLMVVGQRQWCNLGLVQSLSMWSENPELGVIGDLCSSSDLFGGKASVLVMQQHTMAGADVKDSLKGCMMLGNSLQHTSTSSNSRR